MEIMLFLLMWICVTVSPLSTSTTNIPVTEMSALYDLYNSTDGESWLWRKGGSVGIHWNFSNPILNNPCVDKWQGIECVFIAPYENYHVTAISLPKYNLVGTLPSTLDAFIQLTNLNLYINELTGTIPSSLGNLSLMQRLVLDCNKLTGTIPASLGSLNELNALFLYTNHLVGSIPDTFGNLVRLKELILDTNQLTGTIPASLGSLNELNVLFLYTNYLVGSIPDTFCNLARLKELKLDTNQLTGTIPASLGNLTSLQYFYLYINNLNGTLPATLGNLRQLKRLYLDINHFSGTIPDSLGRLSQLEYLYLESNRLAGTIPESLGKLSQLQYLYLKQNNISGTIPAALGTLTQLLYLYLNSNKLAGTIPDSLGNLTSLLYICLDSNLLSGSIPAALFKLPRLADIELHSNQLTGTIPDVLCTELQQLQLHNNRLSGEIPSLSALYYLQVVLLHINHLTGTLDNIFDPTKQFQIETVVLNNNQFSGTIPGAVFELNLQTFVASSNCFKGPLPITALCSSGNMVSLVVDGMSSGSSCQNKLFTGSLSAYTLQHAIGGTIPTCLFQLPNLTTLHLSGNGFTGSIPGDIVISDTVTDLSISHNALTGTIPEQIQLKKWSNIDLSFNRLSGTLLPNFASNGSIGLENNRLSGAIPEPLRFLASISMLGSNAFSCSYDESDLPQHDPNRERYHCGSNLFNISYYFWLGALTCAAITLVYYSRNTKSTNFIRSDNETLRDTKLNNTLAFLTRVSLRCTLYSVLVLLPLYSICGTAYSTQTHKYAYQISAAFMSGTVPFALYWCIWLILLLIIAMTALPSAPVVYHALPLLQMNGSLWNPTSIFVAYLLINCFVVTGVNAAYVYVAVYETRSLLLIVQTLLSVFKVVWGRWALPYVLRLLTQRNKECDIAVTTQVAVNVLNNIVIPCLVVAVVSPNCFYHALVAAPAVTSIVQYKECTKVNLYVKGQCYLYEYVTSPTSFDPPFTYNYQCSSSLITYYAPPFVSMCIVSTFVTPLAQLLCQWLLGRATAGTYWYRLLDSSLPVIAKPACEASRVTNRSYLSSSGLVTALLSTLALILTFGVMFPPLCVALAISVYATVLLFRVNVSRFVHSTAKQFTETIRVECDSVDSMRILQDSMWILITISCWFYTLFLFDTLGDAVGFEGAYWVLIVMPLMPLVMYILYIIVTAYWRDQVMSQNVEAQVQGTASEGDSDALYTLLCDADPESNTFAFDNSNVVVPSAHFELQYHK